MARRGRFGRTARSAPDLNNTLVSIAREMQNQKDQNIMDAWKQGGLFDGKPVTDDTMLAYWRDRVKGIAKDDPLYETYSNAITQFQYTIAASKMTAKYAQGHASDGEMVHFYTQWAKKIPKNSEFHRQLERDAGQYMRHATARSSASRDAEKEAAYRSRMQSRKSKFVEPFNFLTEALTEIARKKMWISENQDLKSLLDSHPEAMTDLLASFHPLTEVGGKGNESVVSGKVNDSTIIANVGGVNYTPATLEAALHKRMPALGDGPLDMAYYNAAFSQAMDKGYNPMKKDALSTGHTDDYVAVGNAASDDADTAAMVGSLDIRGRYEMSYEDMADKSGVHTDPFAVRAAGTAHRATLSMLIKEADKRGDTQLANQMRAELNGAEGVPSLHETIMGFGSSVMPGEQNTGLDIVETHQAWDLADEAIAAVEGGAAIWTKGEYQPDGSFVATPGGKAVGAMSMEEYKNSPVKFDSRLYTNENGTQISLQQPLSPVYVQMSTSEGQTQPKLVGWYTDTQQGELTTRMYARAGEGSALLWSDKPFNDPDAGQKVAVDGGVMTIDVSGAQGTPVWDGTNFVAGSWDENVWSVLPKTDGSGWTVELRNPVGALQSGNQTRFGQDGGPIPTIESASLTIATTLAISGPTGVANLMGTPQGKKQVEDDINRAAGVQLGPDGLWVPGTGDQTVLRDLSNQVSTITVASLRGESVESVIASRASHELDGRAMLGVEGARFARPEGAVDVMGTRQVPTNDYNRGRTTYGPQPYATGRLENNSMEALLYNLDQYNPKDTAAFRPNTVMGGSRQDQFQVIQSPSSITLPAFKPPTNVSQNIDQVIQPAPISFNNPYGYGAGKSPYGTTTSGNHGK